MCIRQRIGGSNPPLTAIFEKELVRKYGLFFRILHACGGMRTPDWGSTTGAASWTGWSEANRLPEGRAQRVNPPLTAIFEIRARTQVRALFFYILRRIPDRGSATGSIQLCPIHSVNSPLPSDKNDGADYCLTEQTINYKICLTDLAHLPIVAPRCPPRGQAAKQYGEVSEWLKEHAWKVCIRQRIGGSNPPLTAIFEMRARTKVRALFFYILRRGDENSRPGFDNWRSQLDR